MTSGYYLDGLWSDTEVGRLGLVSDILAYTLCQTYKYLNSVKIHFLVFFYYFQNAYKNTCVFLILYRISRTIFICYFLVLS